MRIALYLPKEADSYEDTLTLLKRQLANKFGGYTTYDGTGGWVNDDGELIEEPVTVIESYGGNPSDEALPNYVKTLAERVKGLTGESAVAYALNHEMMVV